MHIFTKKRLRILFFTVLGGAAGLLYYHFFGCTTGGCPITSSPILTAIYGASMGGLLSAIAREDGDECNT